MLPLNSCLMTRAAYSHHALGFSMTESLGRYLRNLLTNMKFFLSPYSFNICTHWKSLRFVATKSSCIAISMAGLEVRSFGVVDRSACKHPSTGRSTYVCFGMYVFFEGEEVTLPRLAMQCPRARDSLSLSPAHDS